MDRKNTMEKRSIRQTPLPVYKTNYDQKPNTSRRRIFTYATVILFVFLILSYSSPLASLRSRGGSAPETPHAPSNLFTSNHTGLVPLEAHIMSKCPDARDCLRDLVVPAMERIVDKVDFRLSYIGSVDENDTVHCKHGATECLGNMMGLCASELFPNNTKISLGFSTCLISSYQRIPDRDLVTQCALEHGISFSDLNACISEEGKGLDLLEASVERSEKVGVKKSCTVRVGGEQWCVRDGGQWKDCDAGHEADDLVKEVEARYQPI